MQFLKTLFWIVIAVLVALFSYNNWTIVPVRLWDGLILETKLPVLIIGAFLIGLLPVLILHRATRWRLKRRIESHERALADLRAPTVAPAPPAETLPPSAAPIAVPPGVA